MPTISVENYLKSIYHLQQQGPDLVGTKAIAERLLISLASVTRMVKSMAERGLVSYQPYRGVRLTDAGEREALRTIRNHRLVELFLIETLGFTWDEVHPEAEALEHAISDRLADRLDAFLGYPKADPHGDPIPRSDGSIHRPSYAALSQLESGCYAVVRRVLDQRPDVLRYLAEHRVTPGARIRIVRREPFEGPVTVETSEGELPIAYQLAGRIQVDTEDREETP